MVQEIVIEWDGTHLPKGLRQLPPGQYRVSVVDDDSEISAEEDAAVRAGLDAMEAGDVRPLGDVIREIRARHGLG